MAKPHLPPPGENNQPINLRDALEERYLAYALSTIMGRALPDARDGLKPVHRRILYGMHILRLDPGAAFKKCAKIVGDVMGSFHPHGDQAIYDALVRLAQDFSSRYPLVDGQGNFGNIDGDGAAAYALHRSAHDRCRHARCSKASTKTPSISATIITATTKSRWSCRRPFPNLLANGAQGIAVGMATSIPPHNVAELCDAALLSDRQSARPTAEQLTAFRAGAGFPDRRHHRRDPREAIVETYRTGRGSFRLRARWSRGGRPRAALERGRHRNSLSACRNRG